MKLRDPGGAEAGPWPHEAKGMEATTTSPARRQDETVNAKEPRLRMGKSSRVALTIHRWPEEQMMTRMRQIVAALLYSVNKADVKVVS